METLGCAEPSAPTQEERSEVSTSPSRCPSHLWGVHLTFEVSISPSGCPPCLWGVHLTFGGSISPAQDAPGAEHPPRSEEWPFPGQSWSSQRGGRTSLCFPGSFVRPEECEVGHRFFPCRKVETKPLTEQKVVKERRMAKSI